MSRRRSLETIMSSELVTISELVQLSGMRYSTLKYYAEIGLLPFEQLDVGLVRRYPREQSLQRLGEIVLYKERDGMTIQDIIEHYHAK
ncbi:MerR family transcriptional regulator [Paenibacillus sp. CF384]|uniref:MerR family transcriptional regulator n=1 Tax=Paenibacillus sp. CF384 TaxID=1884382 RepID=UPI0008997473|nr:MerR family transcriptional regulator [Paenibacillus sp. CF384]SDX16222.1 MerR HTH family regulatory protein [Paenibacillus sp. CF384]